MIASLRGRVVVLRLDSAVIEVGGVGLLAYATPGTLAGLRLGDVCELATSLVVREDALTLYGFAEGDERDVFEAVQTVSGIGPRLALAMLAVHTPEGLRRAVATEDLGALQRVPGIGRKGAQRIVLELADRLGAPTTVSSSGVTTARADRRSEVVDALVGLGWNAKAAEEAVGTVVPADAGEVEVADVASVLRGALRVLGGAGSGRG
jgi:Holliday junction DNA helicase RuvA